MNPHLDLYQNIIDCSLGHVPPAQKFLSKSVCNFFLDILHTDRCENVTSFGPSFSSSAAVVIILHLQYFAEIL